MEFKVTRSSNPLPDAEREAILENPAFGVNFTDHQIIIEWTKDGGWQNARVEPYGPMLLDPSSAVLHYGQEIFEGIKAYRQPDGGISLFRPEANARRFARSAARLALPEMPEELFLETVHALVKQDAGWTPGKVGEALYIRPFMMEIPIMLTVKYVYPFVFVVLFTLSRGHHLYDVSSAH